MNAKEEYFSLGHLTLIPLPCECEILGIFTSLTANRVSA